jgi:L-asparaginase/Glu-tRNA(Gln) amidotransferase subunit D
MFEKADFSIYEVGHGFLNLPHVYGAHDMTSEAAVAKLMWVLGDRENRLEYLRTPLCYEMMV